MSAAALLLRAVVAVALLLPLPGFAGAVFIDVEREWRDVPFDIPSWLPSHGYLAAPLLGEANLFHGRTARPWCEAPSPTTPHASFSWTALVSLVGYVAVIVLYARRTWRYTRRT